MKKITLILILIYCLTAVVSFAQITNNTNTVGLLYTEPDMVSEGLILFAPNKSKFAYLIDNCGFVARKWVFETPSTYSSAYLLPNGNIVRIVAQNIPENGNGCIELRSWEDELLWRYCSNEENGYSFHSDLQYLTNGNFLVLSINILSAQEAINAGVNPNVSGNLYYTESIIELFPSGIDSASKVWEWNMADHLVQNYDSTKLNYGSINEHYRKIDANLGNYFHFNSIAYNAELDQIALSNYSNSEIYIIDHSTTTSEAASAIGGKYGFGGDLLFRWGNPNNYGIESKQQLLDQHNPQWIPNHHTRFGGKLSLFNNRYGELNETSSMSGIFVLDIDPEQDGIYPLSEKGTFLPELPHYVWTGKFKGTNIASSLMSGVNVLPNGHLLICEALGGRFTEVDTSGTIIWAYRSPDKGYGEISLQQEPDFNNEVYKIKKYNYEYIPQLNKQLCGTYIIENKNDLTALCKAAYKPKVDFTSTIKNDTVVFSFEMNNTDSILWDFGDGNTSLETNPIYKYAEVGTYNACLTGYNCYGADTLCKEIRIDQITSINEIAPQSELQIYPVPATTQLHINTLGSFTFNQYSIYNLAGKLIDASLIVGNKINVAFLEDGVYLLQLQHNTKDETVIFKFIKS